MPAIPQSPTTDFTSTTLNGSITSSQLTIDVNDASTIVTPCYAVIDREDNNGVATPNQREVVYISSKASNTLNVVRGVDNSTQRAHNDSAKLEPLITVGFWDDFYDAYDNDHNPADGSHDITKIAVLSGATVQILASKILSSPTITSPTFGGIQSGMILSGPTITSPYISSPTVYFGSLATVTLLTPTVRAFDGWQDAAETWTYATASTITVPAGAASKYAVGDRIKWTQTTVKYGVITAVADTVLTIAVNTDYVVTNAAISANYYSHEYSPIGYPHWFAQAAPTISVTYLDNGSGGQPTVTETRYKIDGRTCTLHLNANGTKAGTNEIIFVIAKTQFPTIDNAKYSGRSNVGALTLTHSTTTNMTGNMLFFTDDNFYGLLTANVTDNATVDDASFTITYEI